MKIAGLTICILGLVILFFGMLKAVELFKQNTYCSKIGIAFDSLVSQDKQKEIKAFILKNYKNQTYSSLASAILKKFPAIHSIKIHKKIDGQLNIFLISEIPKRNINNNFYITQTKKVVRTADFNNIELPSLESKQATLSQKLIDFCFSLNEEIIFDHQINIESENKIYLITNDNPKIKILTYAKNIPSLNLLQICKNLASEYLEKLKKKNLFLDLRFKNQIVLYEGVGER